MLHFKMVQMVSFMWCEFRLNKNFFLLFFCFCNTLACVFCMGWNKAVLIQIKPCLPFFLGTSPTSVPEVTTKWNLVSSFLYTSLYFYDIAVLCYVKGDGAHSQNFSISLSSCCLAAAAALSSSKWVFTGLLSLAHGSDLVYFLCYLDRRVKAPQGKT